MLNTNLLPKQEARSMQLERWRRAIIFLAGGISSVLLIGIALLLPAFLPMVFQKTELERSVTLQGQSSERLGIQNSAKQIQDAKKKLLAVWNFVDSPPKASQILDTPMQLDDAMPGIILTSMSTDDQGKLTINGLAQTREDILNFQSQLEQSGKFSQVYTPLSSLVRGAETFTIQIQLKPNFSL